jgi:hypothetical protein
MKTSVALGLTGSVLALTAVGAAPAQASPYSLDTMSTNMMSASQAASLGVAGGHVRDFNDISTTTGSPDDFWLCDLAEEKQVEVDASSQIYGVTYTSEKSRVETTAGQELYSFASEADARAAMKAVRKAAKKCTGSFTIKEEGGTVTQKLTNGTGTTAAGDGYTWIKHVATASDARNSYAEHEYNTFRRVGTFVQVLSIENGGANAPKLTSSQVTTLDRLTGTLGDYWAW